MTNTLGKNQAKTRTCVTAWKAYMEQVQANLPYKASVSYTHLDVYKRQKIESITRTPSGMVCTEGGSLGVYGVPSQSRCARQLSRRESQRICKGRGC